MAKKLDVTGERYSRLVALHYIKSDKWGKSVWRFRCDCGNIVDIQLNSVRQGKIQSCGCLLSETTTARNKARALPSGEANKRLVYLRYKNDAKRRDLPFLLTFKQFENVVQQNCSYCGAKPSNKANNPTCNGSFIYQGIDRKDNTEGYTIENCAPCCFECNQIKRAIPYDIFIGWLNRVIEFNKNIEPAPEKVK